MITVIYVILNYVMLRYDSVKLEYKAPFILPEFKFLESVTLEDDRYHGFTFSGQEGMEALRKILHERKGKIFIRQKAGWAF